MHCSAVGLRAVFVNDQEGVLMIQGALVPPPALSLSQDSP
eukprot:COSAG01_NODE_51305_length_355_cov_12.281250_2_plen_39_part_01